MGGNSVNILIAFALYIKGAIQIVIQLTKLRFMSSRKKDLEIVGLRSQLALYEHQVHTGKRPKP